MIKLGMPLIHQNPALPLVLALFLFVAETACGQARPVTNPRDAVGAEPHHAGFFNEYCVDCHSGDDPTAGFDLESLLSQTLERKQASWEKVARKLRARQMPPRDMLQPHEREISQVLAQLVSDLDSISLANPNPGRTETFRRLTRMEYENAIRDLLDLKIDATQLLPADEVSHGFDNITVGELSPMLLNRYISTARKISKQAIGSPMSTPDQKTFRIKPDVTQEKRQEGLPLGTRGGTSIEYHFPRSGEYEIKVRLTRDRNEHVEGLNNGEHEMEILLDLERQGLFKVKRPGKGDNQWNTKASHADVDRHLKCRVNVAAGPHRVAATFLKKPSSLLETARQPLDVHYNMYRHPRLSPAVYQITITGPFDESEAGETPSRERIFSCYPTSDEEHDACAREILAQLMRRAYRQPVRPDDFVKPMALFHEGRKQSGFEGGIELALSSILINPKFLFRVERDPLGVKSGTIYRIGDIELASRLSFFLWSSIPDEELLSLAEEGRLSDPDVLEQQTLRMLADPRSEALVKNFAGQWLYLRNLESISPDARLFPNFGDNLRQALRRETELFFESIIRADRPVNDLLSADYTFLNERLAKHYNIPHVYGSRFRRVELDPESHRGGLLRHGSILTVTSYATRTSPVIRGKWILENILGTPPPPPPPNVPDLEENTVSAKLPVRQRLAKHREAASCATCHDLIDPIGFSLENFDALGRWRERENGQPVDATGGLPDGREFVGVDGLENGLLARPELFAGTMTEKLMIFALGRGLEYYDAPAIRKILREAEATDYRFSALVIGIVNSTPFQMRMAP